MYAILGATVWPLRQVRRWTVRSGIRVRSALVCLSSLRQARCATACSLWLAQVRHLQGRRDEAHELFERVLALRNDLGFFTEEYDRRLQRLCGNFSQKLSHVALINAARVLGKS